MNEHIVAAMRIAPRRFGAQRWFATSSGHTSRCCRDDVVVHPIDDP